MNVTSITKNHFLAAPCFRLASFAMIAFVVTLLVGCDSTDSQIARMDKFWADNVSRLTLSSERADALARFALEYDPQDGEQYFYRLAASDSAPTLFGMVMRSYDPASKTLNDSSDLRRALEISEGHAREYGQWNANFIRWLIANKTAR